MTVSFMKQVDLIYDYDDTRNLTENVTQNYCLEMFCSGDVQ